MESCKLEKSFIACVARGHVELACNLIPSLLLLDTGRETIESVALQLYSSALDTEKNRSAVKSKESGYAALRLLFACRSITTKYCLELLHMELLLRTSSNLLTSSTCTFVRTVLFSNRDITPTRRISHYIALNPALMDICKNLSTINPSLVKYFIKLVIKPSGLEEVFQGNLVSSLKRSLQQTKLNFLDGELVLQYLLYIDLEATCSETRNMFHSCLALCIGSPVYQTIKPSYSLYRVTMAALTNDFTARKLAQVQLEIRQGQGLTDPTSLLEHSFEDYILTLCYDTLDNKTCFVDQLLNHGLQLVKSEDWSSVALVFGAGPLHLLKPILLALSWDSCTSHIHQAQLLTELGELHPNTDSLIRRLVNKLKEQVDVGRWCEQHVKPLLKDTWNTAAAATVTSSRSILHVIISLGCVERLGQEKVLGLMFNAHDRQSPFDLPLSEAPTIDQAKDIVTFCSGAMILNIIQWLRNTSGDRLQYLTNSTKHLQRIFPLYTRAEVLTTAFSLLIHSLKSNENSMLLNDIDELIAWFEQQVRQFDSDKTSLSLGHFDSVKIFRELAVNAKDHSEIYMKLKSAIIDAKWRVELLQSLIENDRSLAAEITSSPLSFLCAAPADLLKLCLLCNNTDRAAETLVLFNLQDTSLSSVVDFQKGLARCLRELERKCQPGYPARSRNTSNNSSDSFSSHSSRASSMSRRWMQNVVAAAGRSAERTRVPGIVSKLTSTLSKQQFMIDEENFGIDKEVLMARLLAEIGCTVGTPKPIGMQLIGLALERLQENPLPDSSIETFIRRLHSTMLLFDAKPYPGVSVASSSPKEYFNSIYPCISHDVLSGLLDFNENQAVAFNDILSAVKSEEPVDDIRMKGVLTAARDLLNHQNYTSFLSTSFTDKYQDYLGCLLIYLETYISLINSALPGTGLELQLRPSKLLSKTPSSLLGKLVLKHEIPPKALQKAADFIGADMLQLLVLSSFPNVCTTASPPQTFSLIPTITIEETDSSGYLGSDNFKLCKILDCLQSVVSQCPELRNMPLNSVLMFLERVNIRYNNEVCNALDLIRLLADCGCTYKQIFNLQPSRFDPFYVFGILFQEQTIRFEEVKLRSILVEMCRDWITKETYIDETLHLNLHPFVAIVLLLLKDRKDFVKEFLCVYTDEVCEFLGDEIENMLECPRGSLIVFENAGTFFLGKNTETMLMIEIHTCLKYKFKSECQQCEECNSALFRAQLKGKTPAFDFIRSHNEGLSSLAYIFSSLSPGELSAGNIIIDDALLSYSALQNYVNDKIEPYLDLFDKEFVKKMEEYLCCPADVIKQDLVGNLLFGTKNSTFLVHVLKIMVDYHLIKGNIPLVRDLLSKTSVSEVFGTEIPDTILLLSLDSYDVSDAQLLNTLLAVSDKYLGLEYAVKHYSSWPIGVAINCFTHFHEVLGHSTECMLTVNQCLDRCCTMERINKIMGYSEHTFDTCQHVELYIRDHSDTFTRTMMTHKEFTVCHRVIELGSLSPTYELLVLAEHIVYMIQNDNFDSLDVYNLLENKLTEEVCEALCHIVPDYTNNSKIHLSLIDLILGKFNNIITDDMAQKLKVQKLGSLMFKSLVSGSVPAYEDYEHLLHHPLILLEQLIINTQIHIASAIVEHHIDDIDDCGLLDDFTSMITVYIQKSLVFEAGRARGGSMCSRASISSRMSTMSISKKPLVVFDPPYKPRKSMVRSVPVTPAQWTRSKNIRRCQGCKTPFSFMSRKHHCRWCGKVMCNNCCPIQPFTSYFGIPVRLCGPCYFFVLDGHYHTEDDTTDEQAHSVAPFEILSTNPARNVDSREIFSYTIAPNSELCLSLSRMLPHPNGDILLEYCEVLSCEMTDTIQLDCDIDPSYILGVLEHVLYEAKAIFTSEGLSHKLDIANSYLAYIQICRRLPLSDLSMMYPIKALQKPETLQKMYTILLDKQHPELALSLCTKSGKDPIGIWRKWGFLALRSGDYVAAREKLGMCLKNKQYSAVIIEDILSHLESAVSAVLADVTNVRDYITGLKSMGGKIRQLNKLEYEECLHYLETYSSPVRLLQFLAKYEVLDRAAPLALLNGPDITYTGLLKPLAETGKLNLLFEHIHSNRAQIEEWHNILRTCCTPLIENNMLVSVHQVQIFLKDYCNAARTCIELLRNTINITEQQSYLDQAEDCYKLYIDPVNLRSLIVGNSHIPIKSVNSRLTKIHLQRDILNLLERSGMKENTWNVFSSKADKLELVQNLSRINFLDSLPIGKKMIEIFSLSCIEVYIPLMSSMLGGPMPFFSLLPKLLSHFDPSEHDQFLLALTAHLKNDPKNFDRILALMSSDKLKIQAYINTGKLKNAYLLAAKKALKSEIEHIAEECDKQGNSQIKNFCTKYLKHNR